MMSILLRRLLLNVDPSKWGPWIRYLVPCKPRIKMPVGTTTVQSKGLVMFHSRTMKRKG